MAFAYDEVYTEMKKATKKDKKAAEAEGKKVRMEGVLCLLCSPNTSKDFLRRQQKERGKTN